MLSLQQIENIIKSKYNDLLKHKNIADTFKNFEFDIQRDEEFDYKIWKEITLFFDEKEKLYYEEKSKHDGDYFYTIKKFGIENNAIELKHYLDIEITQQDFMDFIKINKTNTYISKKTKKSENSDCYSFYSIDFDISNKTYKLSSFTKVSANDESALYGDCFMQGKDYWKLYNVIKNLER